MNINFLRKIVEGKIIAYQILHEKKIIRLFFGELIIFEKTTRKNTIFAVFQKYVLFSRPPLG